jgi:uncharacterized protein YggE
MKILLTVLVVFAAAALTGVAQPHLGHAAATPDAKTITVSGDGTVVTVPDRATFAFTVSTNAETAKAALAKNSTLADGVVAALHGAKVQTSGISLDPRLNDQGTAVLGYSASTTVTADAELAQAGSFIDAAVAAGATSISGPSWSVSDRDALYRKALADAVADARAKASTLAESSGLALAAIQTVVEDSAASGPMPWAAADAGAAKLEPGTQTVAASVTVTFTALDR